MKILAVEDDPVAQAVLVAALQSLGHQVVSAADGEAAWSAMNDRSLRVIVCDWKLPLLDGLSLCRRIRQHREDYICFILLTQESATGENLDEAFAAGVDDFLTKPVNRRDLKLRLHVATRILAFTTEMRQLESFLPICMYCRKVRDDQDYWQQIETYINQRAGTRFSHSICPSCYESLIVPEMRRMGITEADLPAAPPPPPPTSAS
jgi:DNA-binding response OmpR family regulator